MQYRQVSRKAPIVINLVCDKGFCWHLEKKFLES